MRNKTRRLPYDSERLQHLLAREIQFGNAPNCVFTAVGWFAPTQCWRVQLPSGLGGSQAYFHPEDYGGAEEALIEALHYRDSKYGEFGRDPDVRCYVTEKQIAIGATVPMSVSYDKRRGKWTVRGYWMETHNGKRRQRKVTRVIGPRPEQDARDEVERIVRAGLHAKLSNSARALQGR